MDKKILLIGIFLISLSLVSAIDIFHFREKPFKIAIYGDSHAGYEYAEPIHRRIVKNIFQYDPDIVFHLGDLIHGQTPDGQIAGPENWDIFDEISGKLVKKYRFYPTIGNHDASVGVDYYLDYFNNLPKNGDEEGRYYYVVDPLAIFIVLDVDDLMVQSNFEEQKEWLDSALTNFSYKRYKFVFFHRAIYTSGSRGSLIWARGFEPIFREHNVDAVFMGHIHAYERFYINGINYVVSGGAGGVPHRLNLHTTPFDFPPDSRIYAEETHNYLTMELTKDRAVIQAHYPNMQVFDSFVINKPVSGKNKVEIRKSPYLLSRLFSWR